MKVKFYILPLLLFLCRQAGAQDCTTLSLTYTTSESRCVSTGSITVQVSGGSGNYNYKAVGPVSTPTTSSNLITGLPTGYYTIQVKDLNTGCQLEVDSAFVAGSYSDPRFQLIKTDVSCAGNDGSVSVQNQQFGRSPFSYTIIAPSPSGVGASNTTGQFNGLLPGEYYIRLQDSCGGIQVRVITVENYVWWLDSTSVTRLGCDSAQVYIRLKDNRGNLSSSGTAFAGFSYGAVRGPGDTVWSGTAAFHLLIGTLRNLTLVARDACGNLHSLPWTLPNSVRPSLSSVTISNGTCTGFTASLTASNITGPNFCLYDGGNNLLTCNGTGTFPNLAYGSYCIRVTDPCYDTTIVRCFTYQQPQPSVGATVSITNRQCSDFTATITAQQNLTNPEFCLYNGGGLVVQCNNTGVFDHVPYGSYCIKTHDLCLDTFIVRCFTVNKPLPILTGYNISGVNCNGFTVGITGDSLNQPNYCLYDSTGALVTCDSSGVFTGIPHGQYCVRAVSCGDTTNSICFGTTRPVPSVGAGVYISNKACTTFSAGIWAQVNLTNPTYCLYDSHDSLLACNAWGTFDSLAYGSYCIKVRNTCYDTTIVRCFTVAPTLPAISGSLQVLSSGCAGVSFQASGTGLTNPRFCLYDAADSLLGCNTTGVFSNQAYGKYCVVVEDGCVDTSVRVCQTFAPVRGISLATSKSCSINKTFIDVHFANGSAPFRIRLYHPNGSVMCDTITQANPFRIELTPVPVTIQYKVIGTDSCGNVDSAFVVPDVNVVTHHTSVRSKCPSSTWVNGAGDITATVTSNYFPVVPSLVKKNGLPFVQSYSSVSGSNYTFADLEPATYVVAYTQQSCNGVFYDTITVAPYAYPSQGQSAIYQCDNNSFSLGADVQGGVSPYSFQIIGSTPDFPSIATQPQQSPVFNINTGTVYSLVRLRTLDACGNATLSDVSVLPLQNVSVTATDSCFFTHIVLSVDTIPNATYLWYRKISPTDSTLIGSGQQFNLPFFLPEERGNYICKVIVNNGCITRLSSFMLDGNCGMVILPAAVSLQGSREGRTHRLYWNNPDQGGVRRYVVQRQRNGDPGFLTLATVEVRNGSGYTYADNDPGTGTNLYRVQVVRGNRADYTNTVVLGASALGVSVYPNPVRDALHITLSGDHTTDYRIEIISASGQLVYRNELSRTSSATLVYTRKGQQPPGYYLLRVTDTRNGMTETRRLLFE